MAYPVVKTFPTRDLNQLLPQVKVLAVKLIAECKKQGIPIMVTQTYRSAEYQRELYNQGRTTKGKIVTNLNGSKLTAHMKRQAFDVAMNVPGRLYDTAMLKKVGAIGVKIGLTWGGNFKSFVDYPHFEYTK